MNRAEDYIFIGHNSISNKWQVRLNSRLQSEHDSLSCAEYAATDLALEIIDTGECTLTHKGTTCRIVIEKL